jgi:hypothetical protein
MNIRESLFRDMSGCSDHNCLILGKKTGMGTNGGCKCLLNMSRGQLNILSSRLSSVADTEINSHSSSIKWIDVNDEKPKSLETVLLRFKSIIKSVPYQCIDGHYRDGNWYNFGNDRVEDLYCEKPTHFARIYI